MPNQSQLCAGRQQGLKKPSPDQTPHAEPQLRKGDGDEPVADHITADVDEELTSKVEAFPQESPGHC